MLMIGHGDERGINPDQRHVHATCRAPAARSVAQAQLDKLQTSKSPQRSASGHFTGDRSVNYPAFPPKRTTTFFSFSFLFLRHFSFLCACFLYSGSPNLKLKMASMSAN